MREFTGDVPWAHLDIAGTAFSERELPLGPKGGTGVAVAPSSTTSLGPPAGARVRRRRHGGRRSICTPTRRRRTARCTPRELAREAARRGVRVLAVTDHDSTEGLATAIAEADRSARSQSCPASRSTATSRAARSTSSATAGLRGGLVPGLLPRPAGGAARARAPDGGAPGRARPARSTPRRCSRSSRRARRAARTWPRSWCDAAT